MGKRKDWDRIGEVVSKIKELGLTYRKEAERFGLKVEPYKLEGCKDPNELLVVQAGHESCRRRRSWSFTMSSSNRRTRLK